MSTAITSDAKLVDLTDEWLKRLRAEGRLEGTTINEYERVLRILVVPELGDTSLHEITTERSTLCSQTSASKASTGSAKPRSSWARCSTPRSPAAC